MDKQLLYRFQNAIDYIEDHLLEKIIIEDVAKSIFMSKSSFYNFFTSILGTTVKDYIRKRRLSKSAYDLIQSNNSIIDIALKYQYNTYESYSRAFKKLFGVSPQKYRSKEVYTNIFPRVTLTYNRLIGGNIMIGREMNKDLIKSKIEDTSCGFILDIDIDHFMSINDDYGYYIGDKVLVEVPERIKKVLNQYQLDENVIRINNDEFAVILKNQSIDVVEQLSGAIINEMALEFRYEDICFHLTVSIGISDFKIGSNDEAVIKNANDAMKLAKKHGKNQYKVLKCCDC